MNKYLYVFQDIEVPKYIQLAKHIKTLIDNQVVEDGEKLLPIRTLSSLLEVNTITVVNAYKRLQTEGYAELRIGSGTFAKRKENNKPFNKIYSDFFKKNNSERLRSFIDFTGDTNNTNILSVSKFKEVINEVLDRDGADALVQQDQLGYFNLRNEISNYFWRGVVQSDNILITSGAQQGIDIITKAMLNVNDNIVVEKPTYNGAISVFKWRRLNIFQVDMQSDGINLKDFQEILKKHKIKCFYTMSYYQNPTTSTYSLEKKVKLLELANKYDFYIIEDDYLSELIYNNGLKYQNFKSLDSNDRVIYIKSFSKIFSPGIRMGYLISPETLSETIQNVKINTDISTSSLMQRVLEIFISKGYWEKHLAKLNELYSERYLYMLKKLNLDFAGLLSFEPPGGGLNFYMKLDKDLKVKSSDVFKRAIAKKVIITPGVMFNTSHFDGENFLRLSFSQTNLEEIENGLNILHSILIRGIDDL